MSTIPVTFILLGHKFGFQYKWIDVHTVHRMPSDTISSLKSSIEAGLQASNIRVVVLEKNFYWVRPPARLLFSPLTLLYSFTKDYVESIVSCERHAIQW